MNELSISDFFSTQYRSYSVYDNERSIPNIIDGLKITQRKVLYTLLKSSKKEIKVAQLSSSVAYETAYHHGEQGIDQVITRLAQNFTGTNNFNYLEPIGQFGSRLCPTPAASRYIFTKLSDNFKKFFSSEDDRILNYLEDDDQKIEPEYYIPLIPGILINSTKGIGTGFASNVLARNPDNIKTYIINKLTNKSLPKLPPYIKAYKGKIESDGLQHKIYGIINKLNTTTIEIKEIPFTMSLEDIKSKLNKLLDEDFIKDYEDNSTEESFNIQVTIYRASLQDMTDEELLMKFSLIQTFTENLTCWLPNHKIKRFDTVEDLIDKFITYRLEFYTQRIKTKIIELRVKQGLLEDKMRFIRFYIDNKELFHNKTKTELEALLDKEVISRENLGLKLYNLTKDQIKILVNELKTVKQDIAALKKETAMDLYLKELDVTFSY